MGNMLKIVADANIPFLKGVFEPYADVVYLPGGSIGPLACKDADALIVRTRTKCNASLLSSSKVSFVATATIGTDHLDTGWLDSAGIGYANAPGCNAVGVMQYVLTSVALLLQRSGKSPAGLTLGVIGAGNTGERVARGASLAGFNVMRNDPPKAVYRSDIPYYSLEEVLQECDIVSCHLPLDDSTYSLASDWFFSKMKRGAIFVNASRGEVVDDGALKRYRSSLGGLILDVWRNEPDIDRELLESADIATPHIAGYSFEGKVNGTVACVRAVARRFGIRELYGYTPEVEAPAGIDLALPFGELTRRMLEVFPVHKLSEELKNSPESFEKMRNNYDYRHEFAVPDTIRTIEY